MSDDMRQELARQEWERQEIETMDAEKSGPIHYSDVRHNGKIVYWSLFVLWYHKKENNLDTWKIAVIILVHSKFEDISDLSS